MRSGNRGTRALVLAVAVPALAVATGGVLIQTGIAPPWVAQALLPGKRVAEHAYAAMARGEWTGRGGAIEGFERALARDPASPYRWCDLGEAYLAAGDPPRAERCIRRAVELGPEIPPVLMRAANFWFSAGKPDRSLPYARRVLALVPSYDQVLFDSFRRFGVAADQVLAAGLPDRRAAQAYLKHQFDVHSTREAMLVWAFLQTRGYADDELAAQYAAFLLGAREYDAAAQAWAAHVRGREAGYPERNAVFNGGFEAQPGPSPFDWRLDSLPGAVARRDESAALEGRASLRVEFAGTGNVDFHHVSGRAVVPPGKYRLQAYLRAENLTTNEGVGLRVLDPEDPGRLLVQTERLSGSSPWRKLESKVVVGPETRMVAVQLVRSPSLKFDNKISGTVWLDAVRLEPVGEPR